MPVLVLIEHDRTVRRALARALTVEGYSVVAVATVVGGVRAIVRHQPQVVIVDAAARGLDFGQLLSAAHHVPGVHVAVTGDDDADAVATLEAGADSYILRPVSVEILAARLRAATRRTTFQTRPSIAVGDLHLDLRTHTVTISGMAVDLTPKEFDLLHYLAANAGRAVTRRELSAVVWPRRPAGRAHATLGVHLATLRRKLGESPATPRYVHTVTRVGVRLADPNEERPRPIRSAPVQACHLTA